VRCITTAPPYALALSSTDERESFEAIQEHYRLALKILDEAPDPELRLELLQSVGHFHCSQGQWGDAANYLLQAVEIALAGHREGRSVASRRQTVDAQRDLFPLAAYALAKSGRTSEAVWMLDSGKARMLVEDMRMYAARPENVSDDVWARYVTASYLCRQTDWEVAHGVVEYEHIVAKSDSRRHALDDAIGGVRQTAPSFLLMAADAVIKRHILDDRTAIITFCCTTYGSVVFVLSSARTDMVDVPEFTRHSLVALIARYPDKDGYAKEGWLGASTEFRRVGTSEALLRWMSQMDPTLADVGAALIAPAVRRLSPHVERLIIAPSQEAYVLPLQAVPIGDDGRALIDRYEVSCVPSLHMLAHTALQAGTPRAGSFLAVSNPTEDARLAFAEYECQMASQWFGGEILQGAEATVERVVRGLSEASIVHFACHGEFHWGEPRKAALLLADGELRVNDLLLSEVTVETERGTEHTKFLCVPFDLSTTRLVTLSACESGTSDVVHGSPSEAVALSSSFLTLGVPSVISSLWAVDDLSTAILMNKMYDVLCQQAEPRVALRAAVRWLKEANAAELADCVRLMAERDEATDARGSAVSGAWRQFAAMEPSERPFRHPYYWAPFIVNGM
jgi:CHAT domain-containing protein